MARHATELFDKLKIKKICSKITLTQEQRDAAKEWIGLLEADKLVKEKENQSKFEQIVLQRILGYTIYDYTPEKEFIDYTIDDISSGKSLCIEVKGTGTKDLFAYQHRGKKDKENPIAQTWTYMGQGYDYGVCSNYKEFVLLSKDVGTKKVHKFNFLSIKLSDDRLDEDKLKEFVGIFSKQEVFTNNSIEHLTKESKLAEQEFTDEFYKLYHETRLMLIKEFERPSDVSREDAIHWAQIFLNRLIFIYFVEDHNFIPDRLFAKRVIGILESPSIDESTQKIFEDILGLFKIMNQGSKIRGVYGFNGGLFGTEIPSNINFPDLRDYSFFEDEYQNSKLSIKSTTVDISVSGIYGEKLSPLIKNLLIMDSYDFTSDLNVNILGHIFEQSISDIESLSDEKISKRKKDGVYYTPDYITDYICRNTIIPYLSKTEKNLVIELVDEYSENLEDLELKIKNLKILDPACGSGAFLVKAVDILLEIDDEIQFRKPSESSSQKGLEEFSKTREINLIIENNIYGVDLNPESVEITKLSLFLKLAGPQSKLGYLSNNIKAGNSLIDDKTVDTNAFSWENEFAEVMGSEKFDVIIGNPPYVRHEFFSEIKPYLEKNFHAYQGTADLYVYFIEKCLYLLKEKGFFSIIVSNKFSKINYGKKIRRILLENELIAFIDFGDLPVFADVTTYPCIITVKKSPPVDYLHVCNIHTLTFSDLNTHLKNNLEKIPISTLGDPWNISGSKSRKILEKIEKNSQPFGDLIEHKFFRGVTTGLNEAFIINEEKRNQIIKEDPKSSEIIFPYLAGKEIKRYRVEWENNYMIFTRRGTDIKKYPGIEKHLNYFREDLEPKQNKKDEKGRKPGNYKWFEIQDSVDYWKIFCEDGIIYPHFNKQCNFTIVKGSFFPNTKGYHVQNLEYWLVAILNSKVINFYLNSICPFVRGGYYEYTSYNVETIPISLNSKYQKSLEDWAKQISKNQENILHYKKQIKNRIQLEFGIEKLSEKIEEFTKLNFNDFLKEIKRISGKVPSLSQQDEWNKYFDEKKLLILKLNDSIEKYEVQINEIVFKMYELTSDEINFIENTL